MRIVLCRQKDCAGYCWNLLGISYVEGQRLKAAGWKWVRGVDGPGGWSTRDEAQGKVAEALFGITPYPWEFDTDVT